MAAEIITLGRDNLAVVARRIAEIIGAGGVIAYPTETFYGLGVDPRNKAAVQRLFSIKGRQAEQPILLLIKNVADVEQWSALVSPQAQDLMERYWPGPLTLLFPARHDVPPELTAGTGKIGLRMPGNELTLGLLERLKSALTGTSANRSGRPGLCTAEEVALELGDTVDLIVDGGTTPGGLPSTVLDATIDPPQVIRHGVLRM